MKRPRLSPSDARREHEANRFWFCVALLRMSLRQGPKQLRLMIEEK